MPIPKKLVGRILVVWALVAVIGSPTAVAQEIEYPPSPIERISAEFSECMMDTFSNAHQCLEGIPDEAGWWKTRVHEAWCQIEMWANIVVCQLTILPI